MKIRQGFVSNSSSSSFIIMKDKISIEQKEAILNNDFMDQPWHDSWKITESEDHIEGSTSMNNYSMQDFFSKIGVEDNLITWDSIDDYW